MRLDRTLAVARKTLRSLKHDRRTAGFLVLMPLFMIAIFGYTFGGELRDVEVVVVNLDGADGNGSAAQAVLDWLEAGETLSMSFVSSDSDDPVGVAVEAVEAADAWAAVVFWGDFTEDVAAAVESLRLGVPATPGNLTVFLDGTNPNIAQAVMTEVSTSVQAALVEEYGLLTPMVVTQEMVYGEGAEFIDFFAPGVMGLAAMMVTFMLSIISFVHERATGTLDRLLTTPATEGDIVAGYAIAFGIVALIQSTVILVAAVLLFQVDINGSPVLVLATILALGVGSQGLGFLLSSVARTEFQAVQFMPIILFPSILLAGVFWPIEAVPALLRPVSYFIPLTYAVDGCRSIMIRGWDVVDVWPQLAVLVCFAVAMLLLSALSLKRRR